MKIFCIVLLLFLASGLSGLAQTVPPKPRVADKKFLALGAVLVGSTVADIELTQACEAAHTCVEGNPLLPAHRAGAYTVGLSLAAVETGLAYEMKKHHSRVWFLGPALAAVGHGFGIATGVRQ